MDGSSRGSESAVEAALPLGSGTRSSAEAPHGDPVDADALPAVPGLRREFPVGLVGLGVCGDHQFLGGRHAVRTQSVRRFTVSELLGRDDLHVLPGATAGRRVDRRQV